MKKLFLPILFLMLQTHTLLAQGEAVPENPQQSIIQTLVMVGIAALFFYIILWRPEQKRRKALETQRKSIKKGDRVVAMGIVGIVSKIDEQTVQLKNPDGSRIEILKAAITDVQSGSSQEEEKKEIPLK